MNKKIAEEQGSLYEGVIKTLVETNRLAKIEEGVFDQIQRLQRQLMMTFL